MTNIELKTEEESVRLAKIIAQHIKVPMLLTFHGDIGAGKTTVIRAMLQELGVTGAIKSPTFSLVESYVVDSLAVHHFDLYRVAHEEELEFLGFRDYFNGQELCIIEWAEHAGRALPQVDLEFKLSIKGTGRLLQLTANTAAGEHLMAFLTGEL